MFKFSVTTGCFYPDDIAYPEGAIPADAIAATREHFDAAMARGPFDTLAVVDDVVVVVPDPGPTLDQAKAAQIAALNAAYKAAINAPVSFTTAAGATAQFPQSDQAKAYLAQCIDAGAAAWSLGLWLDVSNNPVSPFTFADLQGLAAAMEAAETPDYHRLMTKAAQIAAATTVNAVQAITF